MDYHRQVMRGIVDEAGVKPLGQVVRTPGLQAVYRVVVYYPDDRLVNSVATMIDTQMKGRRLWIVHPGSRGNKPLQYNIPDDRYQQFTRALHAAHFDKLHDHDKLPLTRTDFWLVERASGSFVKSLLMATSQAQGDHAGVMQAIRTHLPEAIRELRS